MDPKKLEVIVVISNPRRYQRRYDLAANFIKHMEDAGVSINLVECAFGERPFYFDGKISSDVRYTKVRTKHELWVKENLINIGISNLPSNWKYVGWFDADIEFQHPNFAEEALEMLQHHPIIQPFSNIIDLGPDYQVIGRELDSDCPVMMDYSFCHQYIHEHCIPNKNDYYNSRCFWHPGFAWCATREAIDCMGKLLDRGICGNGDHAMAWSWLNNVDKALHGKVSNAFKDYNYIWQEHCKDIWYELGYCKGTIHHFWHGRRANRKYQSRWNILIESQYDPFRDVKFDNQGLLQLATTNSKLKRDLQIYFSSRNENCIYIGD